MKNITGILILAIIAALVVLTWNPAKAANEPPQVGDTSHLPLVRTASGLTWTVTFRNNDASSSATHTVTDNGDGTYDLAVTWPSAGDWLVTCTPSGSGAITSRYAYSVVPGPSGNAWFLQGQYSSIRVLVTPVTNGQPLTIYQGTYYPLTINLTSAWNLTGLKATLQIRKSTAPQSDLVNQPCTIINAANGLCGYALNVKQTAALGTYTAEVIVSNTDGTNPQVAWRCTLTIVKQF